MRDQLHYTTIAKHGTMNQSILDFLKHFPFDFLIDKEKLSRIQTQPSV
jgi:hypothetical protein